MAFYHMQMQQENIDTGQYQVTVSDRLNNRPIENARVRISYTGAPDSTIEEVTTDSSGRTPVIELKTPPLEYSMEPVEQQPYSEYTIQIEAEGFEPKEIAGSQVLADTLSRQPTTLNVMESGETFQRIVIPPHTLFYEYPPKIEEAEIKPIYENGEIVLSKVVVPEYIVVHDGPVNDSAAGNYYVRYKDYIKNVASSEIYATWHRRHHPGKHSGYHVFYSEQSLYGMVPEPSVIRGSVKKSFRLILKRIFTLSFVISILSISLFTSTLFVVVSAFQNTSCHVGILLRIFSQSSIETFIASSSRFPLFHNSFMLLFQFLMFSDDSHQFLQTQRIVSCHGIWNVVLHNRYFLLNIFQFTLFLIQFGLLNCFLPALGSLQSG